MSEIRTIAVTGITGSQGGAAARHLMRAGWKLRGLTRNAHGKAARRCEEAGVELVQGDMGDPGVLDRLCAGAHGLYAVTDFFHNGLAREVEQGIALADAAKRNAVRHLVFPSLALSERQTNVPYFEAKATIERHIRSIGTPATVLRLSMFMEDLVETKYAPPIWWGTVRRTVGGSKKLMWVAVDDVGAVVSKVFADPATIGETITVAGDYQSIDEARAIFKRVTGKTPLAIPAPLWLCRRVVNADLVPFWLWLGRNSVEANLEPARKLWPQMRTMETWLASRAAARPAT